MSRQSLSLSTLLLLILFAACTLSGRTLSAATLAGRVTAVKSGELFQLKAADGRLRMIKLLGILTPSSDKQQFGSAKRHLNMLIAGCQVRVEYKTVLSNGVILGTVNYGGADIALRMLESGLAAVADRAYLKPEMLEIYLEAESLAKRRKMGFWQIK
jgi:endonuclease YncB( thermonuclease family)